MMGSGPEGGRRGWAWEHRLEGYFRVKMREGGKLCKGEKNSDSSSYRSSAMRPRGQRVKADGIWASQGQERTPLLGEAPWLQWRGYKHRCVQAGIFTRAEALGPLGRPARNVQLPWWTVGWLEGVGLVLHSGGREVRRATGSAEWISEESEVPQAGPDSRERHYGLRGNWKASSDRGYLWEYKIKEYLWVDWEITECLGIL